MRHLRCNATPLTTGDGARAGAMVVVEDITAEHMVVSRQNMIRGLLLDTINHELRTPLTVVLANAELLVDVAPDLAEEVRGPLLAIVRSSEALRDTIQHVSDLMDLESFTHAEREDVEVRTVLDAVANRFWYQAEQSGVVIEIQCPESLRWSLDVHLVVKGFSALVDNALAHGPGHATVTLGARIDDDVLRLTVTDEGPGISPDDRERLVQPFERGLTTLDARHARGLGLPLAHAVATCHHGVVFFTTAPGRFTAGMVLP